MNMFTFSDLFCGIGGLRMAGNMAGGTCVFSSEVNEECRRVHEDNHGEAPEGDLALVDPRQVTRHDLCLASPPCTPFSQAGHMKGLEDKRAHVLYSFFRFLAGSKPRAVLMENVPALATLDSGRTLRFVVRTLCGLGYRVSWAVLPATRFGGCQLRRRLYMVGSAGQRFSFGTLPTLPPGKLEDILEHHGNHEWLEPGTYTLLPEPRILRRSGMVFAGYRNGNKRVSGGNDTHPGTHQQQNRIWCPQGVGPTISSQDSKGRYWVLIGDCVRKLTSREITRIQGHSDTFRWLYPTLTVRQVGNSVHVPTVAAIVRSIREQVLERPLSGRRLHCN